MSGLLDRYLILASSGGTSLPWLGEPLFRAMRENKTAMLMLVARFSRILAHAGFALRNDKDMVTTAVVNDPTVLRHASETLCADKDVVMDALRACQTMKNLPARTRTAIVKSVVTCCSPSFHDSKEVMLAAVGVCGHALAYASERLRADPEVVLAAVQNKHEALHHAHVLPLARDERFLSLLLALGCPTAWSAPWRGALLFYDAEARRRIVDANGLALQMVPHEKQDVELAIAAVRSNPMAFAYASPDLKKSSRVVSAAASVDPSSLSWVSLQFEGREVQLAALRAAGRLDGGTDEDEEEDERALLLAAVARHGKCLYLAPPELCDDDEVVLAAVRSDGGMLLHASPRLRDDEEVVRTAVQSCGSAFGDASERLRSNREILLAALRIDGRALRLAPSPLRGDREMVLAALRSNRKAFVHVDPLLLQQDEEVLAAAVDAAAQGWDCDPQDALFVFRPVLDRKWVVLSLLRAHPELFHGVPDSLRIDIDVATLALASGVGIEHLPRWPDDDAEVVFAALKAGCSMRVAGEPLRSNRDFVLSVAPLCADALRWCPYELCDDEEVVVAAATCGAGEALLYATPRLRGDALFVKRVMREANPSALQYASRKVREDAGVVREALSHDYRAFRWASHSVRVDRTCGPRQARALLSHAPHPYHLPCELVDAIVGHLVV